MELKINQRSLSCTLHGSPITRMSFKHGAAKIGFSDSISFLGPGGTSLSKFASLTNQGEEAKMIFPFTKLVDVSYLEEPTLPSADDDEGWFDILSQKSASMQDRERALADFADLKCETVGEYLEHYLKQACMQEMRKVIKQQIYFILFSAQDVKLLGLAACAFLGGEYEKFDSHPIDCCKLTASSYSAFVGQRELVKQKRIANFELNHPGRNE